MMPKTSLFFSALFFAVGAGAGAFAMHLVREPRPKPLPKALNEKGIVERDDDGDDDLAAANASLVRSLQECNRRLGAKGERAVAAVPSSALVAPSPSPSGRRGGRGRDPAAPPDWQALAQEGAVPYRIPCLRSTPFVPSERQLDRMGLAPSDGEVLKQAYAKSNERMMAAVVPLCARVVGSPELAQKIGPQACMTAITDASRREDPEKMKGALSRVAEVNGGSRPAPPSADALPPVEALMLAMTAEQKAFERDLAAQYGPEEAARIASSRGLCSERGVVRASDAPREPREAPAR